MTDQDQQQDQPNVSGSGVSREPRTVDPRAPRILPRVIEGQLWQPLDDAGQPVGYPQRVMKAPYVKNKMLVDQALEHTIVLWDEPDPAWPLQDGDPPPQDRKVPRAAFATKRYKLVEDVES